MKTKLTWVIIIAVAVAALALYFILRGNKEVAAAPLDGFAQCISDKGVAMYGADWCPHCQNEKKAFGDSFRFVKYIECPKDPNKCLSAGVKSYPTWIFADGTKKVGEQGVVNLSKDSGCALPDDFTP